RRRHEIPGSAQLGGAGAVITESGLVQRHLHEALEAHPSAMRFDFGADCLHQAVAVDELLGGQRRQLGGFAHRASLASIESSANIGVMNTSVVLDSLAGRTALVTGAARRVGAAIARGLHAQGANVAIHFRSSAQDAERLRDELNAARSGSAIAIEGNLLDV